MEGREITRRSITLSDHMSTAATDGSSTLKLRRDPSPPPPAVASSSRRSLTLGSASGKRDSRTLMDIIRDEHPMARGGADREPDINWQSFKNRHQIRTDGGDAASGLPTSPVFGRSVSVRRSPPPPAEEQPVRMSLMALLEQTDGRGEEDVEGGDDEEEEEEVEGGGMHYACCVCMVRHKGSAFIPCGHTFCRLCSRELWVSRGNCPLCNGYILEILDIF